MHMQLEISVLERAHQYGIVEIARRLTVNRDNRERPEIAPPLQFLRRNNPRRVLRLLDHRDRKMVRKMKLPNRDLNIHSEIIFPPQNLDHPPARTLRRRRPLGNLNINHQALQIVPVPAPRHLLAQHAVDRFGLPLCSL